MLRQAVLLSRVLFVLIIATPGLASADVIVSNLTASPAGGYTIAYQNPLVFPYSPPTPCCVEQKFTTGASVETITSITLLMGNFAGQNISLNAVLAADGQICPPPYNDTHGNIITPACYEAPTTQVTGFTAPSIPAGSPSNVTFASNTAAVLAANTTYWFLLETGGVQGSYTVGTTTSASAGLLGSAVVFSDTLFSNPMSNAPNLLIEVDGTPVSTVPEPGSIALFLSAMTGFGFVRKARRRRPCNQSV